MKDSSMDFNRETNKTPEGVFLVQSDGQPNKLFLMEAKLNSRRYGEAAKQLKVYQDAAKKHPRYAKCSIIKVWAPYTFRRVVATRSSRRSIRRQKTRSSFF